MPKETVSTDGKFSVLVGWDKASEGRNGVQIGVDCGQKFKFANSQYEFTNLWFTFRTPEEINELIKVLHKAKRQGFSQ